MKKRLNFSGNIQLTTQMAIAAVSLIAAPLIYFFSAQIMTNNRIGIVEGNVQTASVRIDNIEKKLDSIERKVDLLLERQTRKQSAI